MSNRMGMALAATVALAAGSASADSIRVGTQWHVDVYVVESSQFYQILFPETGEVDKVSKKRSDVGKPRLTQDAAERAALKQRWEKANERDTRVQGRQTELRTGSRELTNLNEDGVPVVTSRPSPELELTPEEYAQRFRRNTESFVPPAPEPSMSEGPASPPGPREAPRESAEPMTEPEGESPTEQSMQEMMQDEQFMNEVERLMMEPYFYNSAEREVFEELRRTAQERMQSEAYYWEALRAQGYMDAQPYVGSGGGTSHSAGPEEN